MQTRDLKIKMDKNNSCLFIYNLQDDVKHAQPTNSLDIIDDLMFITAKLLMPNNGSSFIALFKGKEVIAKQCTKCREICMIANFHNSRGNFANKVPMCKICVSKKNKRTGKRHLTIKVLEDYFIFTDSNSMSITLKKHFQIDSYKHLYAAHIIDGRGTNIIVLYDNDTLIAKQCNICNNLLLLEQFYKSSSGFGDCHAKCEKCTKNKVRKTKTNALNIFIKEKVLYVRGNNFEREVDLKEFDINQYKNLNAEHIITEKEKVNVIVIYGDTKVIFKECNVCKIVKSIDEFHKKSMRAIGNTHANCRDCRNKTKVRRRVPILSMEINNRKVYMKKCSKCNRIRPLTDYRKGRGPGERVAICTHCEKSWHSENRRNNQDIISERQKEAYKKNSEKYKKKSNLYYLKNREKAKKRGRIYYQENADQVKKNSKDWRKRNLSKVSTYRLNYESQKKNLLNTLTDQELDEILVYFSNRCALTGEEGIHCDHFICLSIGHGGTYKGNIIPLKSSLNLSKSCLNPFIWIKDQSEECQREFKNVVKYLADLNNLSVEDFENFVNWCYENPRDIEQIKEENRTSIEIWRSHNLKK